MQVPMSFTNHPKSADASVPRTRLALPSKLRDVEGCIRLANSSTTRHGAGSNRASDKRIALTLPSLSWARNSCRRAACHSCARLLNTCKDFSLSASETRPGLALGFSCPFHPLLDNASSSSNVWHSTEAPRSCCQVSGGGRDLGTFQDKWHLLGAPVALCSQHLDLFFLAAGAVVPKPSLEVKITWTRRRRRSPELLRPGTSPSAVTSRSSPN